jgi:mono/diheme cytochrome c family protein
MSKTPLTLFGLFVVVVAIVVYLAFVNEGSESAATVPVEEEDREAQEIFATNCGTCHTLAAGGTDGLVGPNLDDLLGRSFASPTGDAEQANRDTFEATYLQVLNAVVCGIEGRMPQGILQGEEAKEVAGFVAAYAGQLSPDQGPLVPASERETPDPQPCEDAGSS